MSGIEEERITDTAGEVVYADSLLWMLENSTAQDNILACVDNIPALSSLHAARIWESLTQLSSLVKIKTEATEQCALTFARGLAHLLIGDPRHCKEPLPRALSPLRLSVGEPVVLRTRDLWKLCHTLMSFEREEAKYWYLTDSFMLYWCNGLESPEVTNQKFAVLACSSLQELSRFGGYVALPDLATSRSDGFISVMCLEVINHAAEHRQPLDRRIRDDLVHHVVKAIEVHDGRIATGFDRKRLLELHTQLLMNFQRSRTPSFRDHPSTPWAIRCLILHLSKALQRYSNASHADDDDSPVEESAHPGYSDVGGWEDKLEDDPPIKTNLLQTEPMEYAFQLLLCLGAPSLNNHGTRYTMGEADIVINAIIRFRDSITVNEDLIHTLYAIGHVFNHNVILDGDLLRPVVPFFTRPLYSSAAEVIAAAYRVLNGIGERSWETEETAKSYPALVMEAGLASAIIRSLAKNLGRSTSAVSGSVNSGPLMNDSVKALTRWLAASVPEDSSLAVLIDEAATQSLFISLSHGREQDGEAFHGDWIKATTLA
ncbi:hypothetical protein FRB96_005940 [Tulasnella sp. 330]|nr:hypothetical protein FRB96_005940 [Tulasnella sp. 330]